MRAEVRPRAGDMAQRYRSVGCRPAGAPEAELPKRLGSRLAGLGRLDRAFLRRLAVTGTGNALGRGLGLLLAVMVAALFVPADYGYVRWAISIAMLAAIPAAAGAVPLARALGGARGDPARQQRLVRAGLALIAAVTAACALVAALALGTLGRPVGGVLAVLVGMTLFAACFNVYRGLGSVWRMVALYAGGNALQLVLVLILCGRLGLAEPDLVLVVYGFAWVLVLLLLELRLPLAVRSRAETAAPGVLRELCRMWAPLVLAETAYAAWAWADVVLVEYFLGAAAAGHYALARTIVAVLVLVPEAVAILLLPHVAAEGRQAGGLTGRLLGLTAVVSLALLGGLLLLAPPALHVLADGRYVPAAAAVPGLAVGMAVYALYTVLQGHLVGLGRAGVHAAGIAVMAAATLTGSAVLLPTHGLAGAGLAFAIGAVAGLATLALMGRDAFTTSEAAGAASGQLVRGAEDTPRVGSTARPEGRPGPHIAMVSCCYYAADPRVRRQAEALAAHGYAVDVICQRQPGEPAVEQLCGMMVRRVGSAKYRGHSLTRYILAYGSFFLHALATLTRLQRRHRYAAVQVYSMPEALVLTALWPWLTGVPLIYDAGDLTTELYAAKFGRRGGPLAAAALRLQERLCLGLAALVITVHEEYRRRLLARGVPGERLRVVMNLPDERLFHSALGDGRGADPPSPSERFTLVHHGSLVERYGADLAVQAVAQLRERIPALRLRIYGDGELRPRLLELIQRLDLADRVYLSPGYVPVDELPSLLAAADMAIVPTRADAFTETILPNKLLEYLALGLPTVVTRTRTVLAHTPAEVVEYCTPDDVADLTRAIERVWAEPARRQALAAGARAFSARHRWVNAAAAYCAAIDALVARHGQTARAPHPHAERGPVS